MAAGCGYGWTFVQTDQKSCNEHCTSLGLTCLSASDNDGDCGIKTGVMKNDVEQGTQAFCDVGCCGDMMCYCEPSGLKNQTQGIVAGGGGCSELISGTKMANIGCTDDLAIMSMPGVTLCDVCCETCGGAAVCSPAPAEDTEAPQTETTAAPEAADGATKVITATLTLTGLTTDGAKAIEPAIKAALAAKANVAESAVTITGYAATGRRLAEARRLSGVEVKFAIEVPEAQATAMTSTVKAIEPAALVTEIVSQVETLGLADALKAADPDADLSSVTAEMSDPVAADPTPEPDLLDSAAGVAALLLGAFVLQ
jgi:hypothetical protein